MKSYLLSTTSRFTRCDLAPVSYRTFSKNSANKKKYLKNIVFFNSHSFMIEKRRFADAVG